VPKIRDQAAGAGALDPRLWMPPGPAARDSWEPRQECRAAW
jgi:hypothetical protein